MSTLRVDNLRGQTSDGTYKYIVQVQSTTITDTTTITATSATATGHIVSITPKFSNSLILINLTGGEQSYSGGSSGDAMVGRLHLYRQLTGGSYTSLAQVQEQANGGVNYGNPHSVEFVDTTHATTSAINYQIYAQVNANTYYYNYTPSNLVLKATEIAQ